jgi:hypothetical protein
MKELIGLGSSVIRASHMTVEPVQHRRQPEAAG